MNAHRDRIGTTAAYGPTASLATKLVAAVLPRGESADPIAMKSWTMRERDVRQDPAIRSEALAFFAMHGATELVTGDRIIGCPHEEGIDYPMGRVCPQCPFWVGIDRFTHEPIRPPRASMTAGEVLERLAADPATAPVRALASADALRDELVEPLLKAVERATSEPATDSLDDVSLFSYALYLLAKWREPRAYPLILRWLSLPGERAFEIGGDIVTQDGPRILAAVCDGDLGPIEALAADRRCNEYCRSAAVDALALLAAWAEIPRSVAIACLARLEREGLERVPSAVWESLAIVAADHAIKELLPAVRRAYDEGLVDPNFMHPSELDEVEWDHPEDAGEAIRDRWPPIDDVAEATSWWGRQPERAADAVDEPRRSEKVGRNEPCPCGSGKKFKKCCGE